MKRSVPLFAALLLALLSLVFAQDSRPAAPAQRIISCAPNLTEILFELGLGERIVGVTRYCEFPPEALEKPKLGDLFNPSLEAMVAARPDMIAVYESNAKVCEFFSARPAVRLVKTNQCDTIAQVHATIRQLGEATGTRERAEEIVAADERAFEELRATNAGVPRPRVLLVVGRDTGSLANLYVAGRGSYLDELIAIAGGDNAAPQEGGFFPSLGREGLLALNPDVIVEVHHAADDAATREEVAAAWASMKPIRAVARGNVRILVNKQLTIPGAHLRDSARSLRDALHPPDHAPE